MKIIIIALISGIILGFGAGYLGSKSSTSSSESHSQSNIAKSQLRTNSSNKVSTLSSTTTLDDLKAHLKNDSSTLGHAHLTVAISDLPSSHILNLLVEVAEKYNTGHVDQELRSLQSSLLSDLASRDIDAALQWTKTLKSLKNRKYTINLALSAWAKINPQDSLARLSQLENSDIILQSYQRNKILQSVAKDDPEFAFKYLSQNPSLPEESKLIILNSLAKTHISQVIGELEKNTTLNKSRTVVSIMSQWASEDPDALRAYINSSNNKPLKSAAILALAKHLVTSDPEAALLELKSIKTKKKDAYSTIYRSWIDRDPEAAIANLQSSPDDFSKGKIISSVISSIAWNQPLLAIKLYRSTENHSDHNSYIHSLEHSMKRLPHETQDKIISSLDPKKDTKLLAKLSGQLAKRNPGEAIKLFNQLPNDVKEDNYRNIINGLSQTNPDTALNFIKEHLDSDLQKNATNSLLSDLARQDPETAIAYLDKIPENQRNSAIKKIASSWSQDDLEGAMKWVGDLAPKQKQAAIAQIANNQAYSNPIKAAAIFSELATISDEKEMKQHSWTASNIAQNYAKKDPATAAAWAANLPNDDAAKRAVKSSVEVWVKRDITAASEWANSLADGPVRDSSIAPIVNQLKKNEPNLAFDWANSISDDSKRLSSLRDTVHKWKEQDPDAARTYVENADLTQKEYDKLMHIVK